MLSLAEQPDTFYLRIQKKEDEESLRKKEIVVRWSITLDRGLTWRYLRHEFFERPSLASDWVMNESYQVRMTGGLQALIESALEWEFWREFTSPDPTDPDPPPRLPIDRRRLLQVLVAWRMNRMANPHNIPEAIEAVLKRIGGSINELARRTSSSNSSLSLARAGLRGLSGRTLIKLAYLADQLTEWKVSQFLRSHAMVAGLNVNRKGGHR